MKKCPLGWRIILATLTLVFAPGLTATAQRSIGKYVPDEVLIKLRTGANEKMARSVAAKLNANYIEKLGDLGWVHVKLRKGQTVNDAIAQFSRMADVEAVQPNFYYHALATPNDAMWSNLYGMVKI